MMSTRRPDKELKKLTQDLENTLSEAKQLIHENQSDRSLSWWKEAFGEIALGIVAIAIAILIHFLFPSLNRYSLEVWSSLIAIVVAAVLILRFSRKTK